MYQLYHIGDSLGQQLCDGDAQASAGSVNSMGGVAHWHNQPEDFCPAAAKLIPKLSGAAIHVLKDPLPPDYPVILHFIAANLAVTQRMSADQIYGTRLLAD